MLCHRNKNNLEAVVKLMAKGRPRSTPGVDEAALSKRDPFYFAPNEFIIEEVRSSPRPQPSKFSPLLGLQKLDGERTQLHKIGNKYRYHSRSAIPLARCSSDVAADPH